MKKQNLIARVEILEDKLTETKELLYKIEVVMQHTESKFQQIQLHLNSLKEEIEKED